MKSKRQTAESKVKEIKRHTRKKYSAEEKIRIVIEEFDGLKPKVPARKSFWNKIPEKERHQVVETALDKTELSPRELAYHITDRQGWFISESSVYRILKERGLITSPAWIVMDAADKFKDKTVRVHQQWQTDFT